MRLIHLDTETTGLSNEDRLCQLAYRVGDKEVNELFSPGVPIALEAMATHHITEEMIKDKRIFKDSPQFIELQELLDQPDTVLVAHNAQFDIKMLERDGIRVGKRICTLKLAKYLMYDNEDVKRYTLQNLRYYFNVDVDDARAHDALGDVIVLEAVYAKLFDLAKEKAAASGRDVTDMEIIERMIEISTTAVQVRQRMPFGKHGGKLLTDILKEDRHYFEWLVSKKNDDTDDLIQTIRYLLKK